MDKCNRILRKTYTIYGKVAKYVLMQWAILSENRNTIYIKNDGFVSRAKGS
jgi:hypothetical protein